MGSLLTAAGAAARLGVSRAAFSRLVRDGTIRPRDAAGETRFWPEEVDLVALRRRLNAASADTAAPLLALADALATRGDATAIAETATRFAALLTGAEHAALFVLESGPNQPRLRRIAAVKPIHPHHETIVGQGDIPGWETIVRTRQPLVILDAPTDPRLAPALVARFGLRSLIGVPLIAGNEGIGALVVTRWPEGIAPNPDHLPTLEGMADLVAVALAHARLVAAERARATELTQVAAEERRQRARSTALLRVAAALDEATSLGELMSALAGAAAGAVGVDRAEVHAYDETQTHTVASGYHGDVHRAELLPTVNAMPPRAIPAEAEVIRTGRPLPRDADTPFPAPVPIAGWRSDIVVPLLAGGATQGVLYAWEHERERAFAADDLTLLQAIGQQAGFAILRARDAEAAQRRADHLALLNQVGRALSDSLEIGELCAAIHSQVGGVLAADAFYVALYDEDDAQVWFPYMVDCGQRLPPNWESLGDGPTSRVLRSRCSLVVRRADDPPHTHGLSFGDDRPSESALHVPMLRGDRLIGVLSVQSYAPDAYDADDLRTLETIAQQAAAAFVHARLYAETVAGRDEAQRHAANLEGLLATTRSVASAADLGTTLDVLAGELVTLVPHDEVTLYRTTPDGAELHPVLNRRAGRDVDSAPLVLRVGEGLIGSVVAGGRAERVNDAHLDPRSRYAGVDAGIYAAGEHVVVAPLTVAGQVIGALLLCRLGGTPFSRDEFALFQVLAEQAAVAVRNATLLADAQHARARTELHAANLEAVLATTRAITAQLDLGDTLGALADHLGRLIAHERSVIYRLAPAGGFVPLFGRLEGRSWTPHGTIPAGHGVVGRVTRAGEPAMVNDAHLAPDVFYPAGFPRPEAEHLLAAPLTAGGQTVGAMTLSRSGASRFTAEEFAVFQVLAAQAGVALHASLLFDEERRRRRHATALVAVAATLNGAGSLPEVVRELASAAADAVGVDRCSLYVYDEVANRTVASAVHGGGDAGAATSDVGADLPPAALPVERELLITGRPVVGERLAALLNQQETYNVHRQRGGAALPLRVRGTVQGAMYVWSSREATAERPWTFDADELALLEAIGDQAGVAIERARLQAATERQLSELQVLGGVNEAIAGSLDLRVVAQAALGWVRQVVPSSLGLVALWDEAAPALRVVAGLGEQAARFQDVSMPLDTSLSGLVFRSGQPHRGQVGDGTPFWALPDEDVRGLFVLCVPLRIDERVIGTLHLMRATPGPFSAADAALLRLIAGQLAVGIERARMFTLAVEARERSERQARSLETVLENSQALARQTDLESTLATFSEGISRLVTYSACAVFRAELGTGELRLVHARVIDGPPLPVDRVALTQGITGDAVRRRVAICVPHAETDPRLPMVHYDADTAALYRAAGVHLMAVPLLVEGVLIGAVTINRVGREPFGDEEFAAVRVYAGQAAAAIRTADLLVRNRDLYLAGIRALASAVDAKDPSTRGHSERVSRHAGRIAAALGLDHEATERIELAGLLHDIGKIGIPDAILQKPGPLDDAERATMMGHAALGAAILAGAGTDALLPLVPLVRHHHEWANGAGYPDALAGHLIPLGAAVIAVADAFDTLITDRPYRPRRPVAEAVAELRRAAGTQFRPDVVEALATLQSTEPLPLGAPSPVWALSPEPASDPAEPHPRPLVAAGQMGDARALGLLVELANVTRHIPDLQKFLNQVTAIVRRRLDYEDVMLLLVDRVRGQLVLAAADGDGQGVRPGYRMPLDVGVCGEVIRTGRARNVPDVRREPTFFADWPDPQGAELVVPLIVDDATIGVINVECTRVAAFTAADEAVLTAVAGQVAAAVHVAQLHDAAKRAAATDGLTGVANHRAFYEALDAATTGPGRADRRAVGNRLSVVLMDVEGLKQVNDTAGHLAGDALLRRVADVIRDHVREGDVVARYGGDEFAVIMRGVGHDEATRVAARVRRALLDVSGVTRDLATPRATVRYGVATLPADGTRGPDLVAVADARLYEMRARTTPSDRASLLAGD